MDNKLNCRQTLEQKKELCKTFLNLSKEQQQAITEEDYDLLLETLTKKDEIIEEINQLDTHLGTFSEDEMKANDSIRVEILNILNDVQEVQEYNGTVLAKEFASMTELMKQTRNLKKTHSLYRGDDIPILGAFVNKEK